MPHEFTFPFDTCERPQKGALVAQPWSTFVNCISLSIVFYFLCKVKTRQAFILLIGLFFFDCFHLFSHFIHIQKGIQLSLVHFMAYFLNFSLIYFLYKFSGKFLTPVISILLIFILVCDIYFLLYKTLLWYFFTQIAFFTIVLLYYKSSIIKIMGVYKLSLLLFFISMVYFGFVNEVLNCDTMLAWWPSFPFHAVIEMIIVFSNYIFASSFYNV